MITDKHIENYIRLGGKLTQCTHKDKITIEQCGKIVNQQQKKIMILELISELIETQYTNQ
ncbi:MAG: hypothetical protein RSD22_11430 [Romboutsia sp.]